MSLLEERERLAHLESKLKILLGEDGGHVHPLTLAKLLLSVGVPAPDRKRGVSIAFVPVHWKRRIIETFLGEFLQKLSSHIGSPQGEHDEKYLWGVFQYESNQCMVFVGEL